MNEKLLQELRDIPENEGMKKIAIDFDGTCVDHRYPAIGPDVPGAVEAMKKLNELGYQIILCTMRSGHGMIDAVRWFEDKGIKLYAYYQDPDQKTWTDSPKCFAHMMIDDTAYGCPLIQPDGFWRPCVDWSDVLSQVDAL